MKKFTKKIVVSVLSALCMLFMVLGCVGVVGIQAKAETAVVNLTFNTLGLNGVENNDNTFGGTKYYTCIRFTTGVFSGDANGAFDFSDMTEKASYVGSGNADGKWGFAPAYSKWPQGYKNDAVFNFIYVWTANQPTSGDTIAMKAGSYFTISGTFADGTGACDDKYVLSEDINLQFNGTAWETYVEPTKVTFTHINSTWNDNTDILNNGMHYTVIHLAGVQTSGYLGQGDDWSEMMANATINGGKSYFNYSPASYIAGPNVAADFIILYSATAPTAGDVFFVPAGTTFKVGGADKNSYELANDIKLTFNGTAWVQPASVNYTIIKVADPYEAETFTTFENTDGTFTYTLPEYTREGKVLLGYVVNVGSGENFTQMSIPSGEYTTSETEVVFIALWGEFNTIDGASIRIASAETSGIRWTTTIDTEGFGNIVNWAKGGFEFGTELSAEGFGENFDIAAKTWKVENSTYTGVLIDINANYYNTVFAARGYVDITYANGATKRIYATANDTARSIRQVAQLAIASGDYSGAQLTILQQIAGV